MIEAPANVASATPSDGGIVFASRSVVQAWSEGGGQSDDAEGGTNFSSANSQKRLMNRRRADVAVMICFTSFRPRGLGFDTSSRCFCGSAPLRAPEGEYITSDPRLADPDRKLRRNRPSPPLARSERHLNFGSVSFGEFNLGLSRGRPFYLRADVVYSVPRSGGRSRRRQVQPRLHGLRATRKPVLSNSTACISYRRDAREKPSS